MTAGKLAAGVISALVLGAAMGPGTALAAEFEGTVIAKNKDARTFTLRQDEGGGTFKIKVTNATRFERLSGFGAIQVGARNIDVTARKSKGRWIASEVERSGKVTRGGEDD
jgi:hypothetical protein